MTDPARPDTPQPAGVRTATVPAGLAGARLDSALATLFGISRSAAADLVAEARVELAGRTPTKSARVEPGQPVRVRFPEPAAPAVETPALAEPGSRAVEQGDGGTPRVAVSYADDDIVVVDKPAGVAAHGSPGWTGPTVLGQLAAAGVGLTEHGPEEQKGIVHRLDVGTSGVMVLARSNYAYSMLKNAFRNREVIKTYHCLVQGLPDPLSGTIDAPIARRPGADFRFGVVEGGRRSITHYDLLEAFRYASLLTIGLETGRTHQIRVHMQAIGHPCCGDPTYGGDPRLTEMLGLRRQWLHAVELGFEHPGTGERVSFESPHPDELQHALDVLDSV